MSVDENDITTHCQLPVHRNEPNLSVNVTPQDNKSLIS